MRVMRRVAVLLLLAACTNAPHRTRPMTNARFARYIALGDSISIDVYPAADIARRYPRGAASSDAVGAASLFFRNDDTLWPEFRGHDLRTRFSGIELDDFTADGATTRSLLTQVARVSRSDEPTLATITAGGNDLLGEIGFRGSSQDAGAGGPVPAVSGRLRDAVSQLLERRPNSVVIIGTVYDPSDGTNRLPGVPQRLDTEAKWLRDYNDAVRQLVKSDPRLRLADIQAHFLGHGLSAGERERWYLAESIIEPNARGASEVRRLWLDAVGR
jgi:lysophospholipase L1-like esterase